MAKHGGERFERDLQYYKFCAYGFLKDLRFFDPFMILMFLDKGLSYAQIGSLYALREILINVMEIPSGVMADALGRRRTMIMSFTAYIASFVVFYLARGYAILVLAMAVFAFGDAFRTGTHKAMIFDYLKLKGWADQKTHYYGHTRSWSQRGAALSSLIAAALVIWRGEYRVVFLFTLIPYVLDLLLMLSYPAALDGPRRAAFLASVNGVPGTDGADAPPAPSVIAEFRHVVGAFASSFKDLFVLRAVSNQALYTGYYKAAKDYLQPLLAGLALSLPALLSWRERERTALVVGVVYFGIYSLTSYASRRSGRFSERFDSLARPLNLTLIGGLGLGLASGLSYALGFSAPAALLYVGVYVIENLRKPMGIAYVTDLMNQDALATALSAESQAETLFAALVALGLGFAADALGPGLGLAVTSGACLAIALLLRLPERN
ncbi:MAG: MFS transporter [Spirochaetae bacterium HGW-Spirochaetae-3]|jgi:MFS family permease|nr:MAG: MFS transporter [Spirochaetae bacterium HGW-Spirochaetae-3]